ncbi:hypothetical protein IFM89_017223 [Coptis chinensis]|uniref:Uncharacterized protein n=1 Tax=Coptis chinensis TaxID=261450 RepID=A0A835HBJ5_9MAGN|nr:hypothetical protein IFM89_017223 [Coptis chinensis]
MGEFLQKIKEISDSLAAAGVIISDADLVSYVYNGLPSEDEAFCAAVTVRKEQVLFDELHNLLLSEEITVSERNKSLVASSPQAFSVNRFAQQDTVQNGYKNNAYAHIKEMDIRIEEEVVKEVEEDIIIKEEGIIHRIHRSSYQNFGSASSSNSQVTQGFTSNNTGRIQCQ